MQGYSRLSPEQQQLLSQVFIRHLRAQGQDVTADDMPEHIVKVAWNKTKNCLIVHFKNDWYHYTLQGTWY